SIRLSREQWAMSGGATMWGLLNSYFLVHPEEAFDWVTENAVYLDTLDTIGSWHMAHNAWYALAHWGAFQVTEDSTYFYNHAFLTDTLWLMDTDDDGGIQAEFDDTENMDQSWCTAYLGMMCFDPLLTPGTFIGDYRENLPGNFAAASNYPNPFNSSTNIRYRGFPQENITVEAFDILGRKVDTVFDGLAERSGLLNWNASGFSSGVYFLRVSGIDRSAVTRAILVK
ncbi:MAG: T9SS type A sorting domain-containing protein, partial [candidate division Zixibacteria bacterium]|nr:T9SS type A sorting domain-containing protein [candidate division Zixibacteria bacterium]